MKTAHKTLAAIFAILAITLFAACSDSENIITSVDLNGTTYSASDELFGENFAVTLEFTSSMEVTVNILVGEDEDEDAGIKCYYYTYGSTVEIYSEGESIPITLPTTPPITLRMALDITLTNSSGQLSGTYYLDLGMYVLEIPLTFTKS